MKETKRIYGTRLAVENYCKYCNKGYTILRRLSKCSCKHPKTKGNK